MAALEPSSGLMDIAASLTQDEIPFKLRCAICNKLALNAFRLPCCDQAICETCQGCLPESCPVCAHTPLDAALCKPNKALRTTLKAFLRTEEKKREKDRPVPKTEPEPPALPLEDQSEVPTPATDLPQSNGNSHENSYEQTENYNPSAAEIGTPQGTTADATNNDDNVDHEMPREQNEVMDSHTAGGETDADKPSISPDAPTDQHSLAQNDPNNTQVLSSTNQATENAVAMGAVPDPNAFQQQLGWQGSNFNQMMPPFMANGMPPMGIMPFQNPMGPVMPGMGIDPMVASQGMFSDYGMNMNGMNGDMSMGMNFNNGQGMYGNWDVQNNMWNGGPDKFNANAFANRMGADYGSYSGYAGYNMSQPQGNYPHMHHSNNDFHGSYGPYGRGSGRGRGFGGRGRGGYNGSMHGNYHSTNQGPFQSQYHPHAQSNADSGASAAINTSEDAQQKFENELRPGGEDDLQELHGGEEKGAEQTNGSQTVEGPSNEQGLESKTDEPAPDTSVPIETSEAEPKELDQLAPDQSGVQQAGNSIPVVGEDYPSSYGHNYYNGPPHGYSAHQTGPPGYGFNQKPRGMGVVGAPAAPRAMREGLPNTSIRNSRGFIGLGRVPNTPSQIDPQSASPTTATQENGFQSNQRSPSRSRSPSRRSRDRRHRSRSRQRSYSRSQSPEITYDAEDKTGRHRSRKFRKDSERDRESSVRSRSASVETSHRTSHRARRERDRRDEGKGTSSRRNRSHTRKDKERTSTIQLIEDIESRRTRTKEKEDRHRRRERDKDRGRDRDDKGYRDREKLRGREKDKEREKDRGKDRDREKDRDRDKGRDRHRDKDRGKDKDGDRERDSERDRARDRKRRRERSGSRAESEHSRRHARRPRRDDTEEHGRDRNGTTTTKPPSEEKDPHTLEREARNRERLLKEQQRREAMNADRGGGSGRRRESKLDRGFADGRRLSYKYEDEVGDQARAAQVEHEREAARWG